MKNKKRNALFRELREEAKRINAWEALELIQQAQTAFDCADFSYGKTFNNQLKKIDSLVARIRNILPNSDSTNKLEAKRRHYQSIKDTPIHDDIDEFGVIDNTWCVDDD